MSERQCPRCGSTDRDGHLAVQIRGRFVIYCDDDWHNAADDGGTDPA